MTPFQLAWLNLTRRKASTAVALISIAISIVCSGIMYRLYVLSQSHFKTFVKGIDAVVGAKTSSMEMLLNSLNFQGGYPGFIPFNLYHSLKNPGAVHFKNERVFQAEDFKNIIPIVFFAKFRKYRVVGTDESFWNPGAGSNAPTLARGTWFQNPKEAVLGASVAAREHLYLNDAMEALPWLPASATIGNIKTIKLKVIGILNRTDSVWDMALFTNYQGAWDIFRENSYIARGIWGTHVLHYMLINIKPEASARLRNLINNGTVSQLIYVEEEKQNLSNFLGASEKIALLISLFILILGGLAVSGVMLAKFDGMFTQFAVLRAIGYQVHEILLWLLWEGLIVGITACICGGILDYLLFPWLRNLMGGNLVSDQAAASPLYTSSIVWASAVVATIIAAILPASQLLYKNPHEALKGL